MIQRLQPTAPSQAPEMTENPSPLFEIARVLASFDHVASFIANANHSIM